MKDIVITQDEITELAKNALPEILKESFSSTWSNPLQSALDEVLKSDELKEHLRTIIMDVYKEVSQEVDFKLFVKEAVVRSVIDELTKK